MGTKSDCAERAMADSRTIVSGAEDWTQPCALRRVSNLAEMGNDRRATGFRFTRIGVLYRSHLCQWSGVVVVDRLIPLARVSRL